MRLPLLLAATLALPLAPAAQTNVVPGLDLGLSELRDLQALGRLGSFPNGRNGIALLTTACNYGTVEIPWLAAMSPDHPVIAFLVARERNGRMEQISDRSYVKHGFSAANGAKCLDCALPSGEPTEKLGLGCSDTYSTEVNGDRFHLGPPEEIDPWLGSWNPVCSHFDRGEPAVSPPADCDGVRSLTLEQTGLLDPVTHRIEVDDADLALGGSVFFAQAHYVSPGEAEALRGDNLATRAFVPSWNGASWDLPPLGPMQLGSVLERWSGARVRSATFEGDGRVFVAARVTGPVNGLYRYEYALHNRDASRGVASVRIPRCPQARLRNVGFRDVDDDPANDWDVSVTLAGLVLSTPDNPQPWNTIFNLWFDSDASPADVDLTLEAFAPGPGASTTRVRSMGPTGVFNVYLASACGPPAGARLHAAGDPARPRLGNASFALVATGHAPGAESLLLVARPGSGLPLMGCGPTAAPGTRRLSRATVGGDGRAVHRLPIPADPALEGLELTVQGVASDRPLGGGWGGGTNALRIRVGNGVVDCPG